MSLNKYFPENSIFRFDHEHGNKDSHCTDRRGSQRRSNESDMDEYFSEESIFLSDQNGNRNFNSRHMNGNFKDWRTNESDYGEHITQNNSFQSNKDRHRGLIRREADQTRKQTNVADLDQYFSENCIFRSDQNEHRNIDADRKEETYQEKNNHGKYSVSEEDSFEYETPITYHRKREFVRQKSRSCDDLLDFIPESEIAEGCGKRWDMGEKRGFREHLQYGNDLECDGDTAEVQQTKNYEDRRNNCAYSERRCFGNRGNKGGRRQQCGDAETREPMQRHCGIGQLLDHTPQLPWSSREKPKSGPGNVLNKLKSMSLFNLCPNDKSNTAPNLPPKEDASFPKTKCQRNGRRNTSPCLPRKEHARKRDRAIEVKSVFEFQIKDIGSSNEGIVSNGDDSCWVFSGNEQRLLRLGPNGQVLENIRTRKRVIDDVTVDPDGNIYYSCPHEKQIIRLDRDRKVGEPLLFYVQVIH